MGLLSQAMRNKNAKKLVEVDEGIYAAIESIAKMRETTVETIVEMQLTRYIRFFERSIAYRPEDIMPFGQYKGFTVGDVIKTDPRYIAYMHTNSNAFNLDQTSIDLLESLATEDTPS